MIKKVLHLIWRLIFKKKKIFNFVMHDISSKPFISLSTPVRKIFCEMQ